MTWEQKTPSLRLPTCRESEGQGWDGGGSGGWWAQLLPSQGTCGSQERWVWEAEEEEGSPGKRSMERCPVVVTHVCLVPETRDAEGLQQVTAAEQ